ncbi:MAG: two pore domain potassium channel family protein [Candidatus Eremiobacteraeota bacterium]|nr:two pore domain potassium channel family protein [Candidatus Eremiobacteraeota bacterium]
MEPTPALHRSIAKQRFALLISIDDAMEKPIAVLGFAWLVLVIVSFVRGPSVAITFFTWVIWGVFILDFGIRLLVAPRKLRFLRRNALTAIALVVPALGIFRLSRVLAFFPTWQVATLRLVSSVNRSLKILSTTMERRGLLYVIFIIGIVTFAGAAGMLSFEQRVPGTPMHSYGYALWWTSMTLTTMGSDYFPHTAAGRLLCLLLSVFGFTIFGYVTGALSSYFINKDADDGDAPLAGAQQLQELLAEVKALKTEMRRIHTPAPVTPTPD